MKGFFLIVWLMALPTLANAEFIMSYDQLLKLNSKQKSKYLLSVAKELVLLEEQDSHSSMQNLLDLILPKAYAADDFRCIGGGVPIAGGAKNCGALSYAGFTCSGSSSGKEICNPLIFGVKRSNNSPMCFTDATTKKCYEEAKTGDNTHFPKDFFKSFEVKETYQKFKDAINKICTGKAKVTEPSSYKNEACALVKKQTRLNLRKARNNQLSLAHTGNMDTSITSHTTYSSEDIETELGTGNSGSDPIAPVGGRYHKHSQFHASEFIKRCKREGVSAKFCKNMTRPNPAEKSKNAFHAVYGKKTPHLLVPPPSKWSQGIRLLKIAESSGECIQQINNWYRPTEYNSKVSKAAKSQHINANAIDIYFCSRAARNRAIDKFKKIEKTITNLGIGTYSSKGSRTIHLDFKTRNYHN